MGCWLLLLVGVWAPPQADGCRVLRSGGRWAGINARQRGRGARVTQMYSQRPCLIERAHRHQLRPMTTGHEASKQAGMKSDIQGKQNMQVGFTAARQPQHPRHGRRRRQTERQQQLCMQVVGVGHGNPSLAMQQTATPSFRGGRTQNWFKICHGGGFFSVSSPAGNRRWQTRTAASSRGAHVGGTCMVSSCLTKKDGSAVSHSLSPLLSLLHALCRTQS